MFSTTIATAKLLTEGKTASQAGLHVLSYLNDLATGNLKGNIRKYYSDYLSYRKNLISKFINRNMDTNTLQRRINTIIEVNRQEALRNLRKHLANKNYTGTENINEIFRFIKKAVTNKPKKNFIAHKITTFSNKVRMESKNTPVQSLHELVELHNKLVGENNSAEDWVAAFGDEEKAKEEVYSEIKDDIKKHGYDGPEDYTAMYWFSKGIVSIPKKQKTQANEIDAELMKIMSEERPGNKEADSSTIIDTIPAEEYSPELAHDEFPSESSSVDSAMEQLWRNPTNWYINFEQFNNEEKKALFPKLKKFFDEEIGKLSIINMYKIQYKVNTEWRSMPLKPEVWNKLMENFTLKNFIFDMDDKPPEYFYEKGSMELPTWSLFSALKFSKYDKYDSNNDIGGSFFRYLTKDCPKKVVEYLKRLQIFDRLGEERKGKFVQRRELEDCCFVYALKQTGQYDEKTLNQIRLRVQNRYLSQSSINKLCEEFKIHLNLTYIDEESNTKNKKKTIGSVNDKKYKPFMGIKNAAPNRTHHMNIFEKHYFLEEETPFSAYYIKHLSEVPANKYNMEYNVDHWRKTRTFIKASNLVRELFKQGFFKPITFGEYHILNTVFYNEVDADIKNINLEYDKEYCTKLIAPQKTKASTGKKTKADTTYWYADFEADVSGKYHKAFMCVLQGRNGQINKEFCGENCAKDLLEYLPDEAVIYFHNLAYDIRMIAQYGIRKSIIKGTKTMKADIKYGGKDLHFKDSLPILSCKLSQLPSMFNIKGIQKEIFPYKYYTLDRLKKNRGKISEAGQNEDKPWTDADYDLFKSNIDKIPGCRLSDTEFDMWKYASFYCQQDVKILRLGFNQFREGFIQDFHIDPFKFISISSLANEVFNQRVYYNHNLHMIGGVVRKFCSHAVYGGRCMTAYNKKWHTTKPLSDFDAVSLYPSAMARLYTVEGTPEVIKPEQLNLDFLSKQGAYIVEIKITKVNKHYAFPLIVRKTQQGLNLNSDMLEPGETVTMVVDNITLEDLIEFQKIEFEFIRGYYWSGKRDYTIQKEIRNIFNKRIEYKKQKNPLQNLYKLIMNSTYGKTIMRPVEKDYKYFREGDELNKFWNKNYFKIVDDVKIEGSDIHAVRTLKPIDKHFNFSLLGIQVLSMSKRIMNEVMCLAFDLGCHIYYQDTDSMHIEVDDLPKLVDAFREKYGRELIGSDMGQFHSDFPTINGHDEMPKAIESYFLMKKMYVDKLQDSTGDIDYMIRGKGLTQNSIKYAAKSFSNDPMHLYKHIYEGHSQTFDLTQGQPCFSMNKNMTVSTNEQFKRNIKTTYMEGYRDDYFTYASEYVEDLTSDFLSD